MDLKDTVNNRNILSLQFKHCNVPLLYGISYIIADEENVTALESWRHTFTEDHHEWAFSVEVNSSSCPPHEGKEEDQAYVAKLINNLIG